MLYNEKGLAARDGQPLQNVICLAADDDLTNSEKLASRQATHIQERSRCAWAVARAVAELAFACDPRFSRYD